MRATIAIVFLAVLSAHALVANAQLVDIVQTAINNGNFKILVKALTVANLVKTLQSPGPFTVFAPTDAAFNKLPPGTIDNLLKPENRAVLIKVLTYHVIGGREYTSARLLAMQPPFNLTMLEGNTASFTVNGNQLKINDATIIVPDVLATNGIIHVLDTVILPPSFH